MEPIARSAIKKWNQHVGNMKDRANQLGLIAVSFDQRNHGTREVHALANQDWRSGNERHAQDMFGSYRQRRTLLARLPEMLIRHRWHRTGYLSPVDLPSGLHLLEL